MYNQLLFRNQFIAGGEPANIPGWKQIIIKENFFISSHPELNISKDSSNKNFTLTLIGFIIDPFDVNASNEDVLENISNNSNSFKEVIINTKKYSGRWAIIYTSDNEMYVLNDPIGSRQIYHTSLDGKVWIASQPTLLSHVLKIEENNSESVLRFINSQQYESMERMWIGNETIYKNIYHLIPNHYLDMYKNSQIRFFPNESMTPLSIEEGVEIISEILRNSLIAANKRFNLMLAVTGGLDSRVILAASQNIKSDVYYYLLNFDLPSNHHDIVIPTKLLGKLGLKFNLVELNRDFDDTFKQYFHQNVSQARKKLMVSTNTFSTQFDQYVKVSGIASEIGRNFYEHYEKMDITPENIAAMVNYENNDYVIKKIEKWLEDVLSINDNNISILDLFYWEQRSGNWAALGTAEGDIGNEEFIPFNNRLVIETMLRVDKKHRKSPNFDFYKKLINAMCPEISNYPINETNKIVAFIKDSIRRSGIVAPIKRAVKAIK